MTSSAAQSTGHTAPHQYRKRRDVEAASRATERAIQYVIANWHFCICRELAAANDGWPDAPSAA